MPVAFVEMSPDQRAAHDAVVAWASRREQRTLTLGGLAGAGKTTVIAQIVATLRAQRHARIAFCCFTGKASLVLRRKLVAAGVLEDDYCGTIHGLIYEPIRDGNGKLIWTRRHTIPADLIVLDEASMVDEQLYKDLVAYDIPILAVGDHGQLPPIQGALNLMASPEIRLEKIHRQAEGNPIIQASMRAREGKGLLSGPYGTGVNGFVLKVPRKGIAEIVARYAEWFDDAGLVLCGTNATRIALNYALRARLGHEGPLPRPGERVICLRNNRQEGLYNGLTGTLKRLEHDGEGHRYAEADIDLDGGRAWSGDLRIDQFGAPKTIQAFMPGVELFDWGYALTVHKAQGSESPTVVVFEECAWMEDDDLRRRWRYTAYTRAAERLLIVG